MSGSDKDTTAFVEKATEKGRLDEPKGKEKEKEKKTLSERKPDFDKDKTWSAWSSYVDGEESESHRRFVRWKKAMGGEAPEDGWEEEEKETKDRVLEDVSNKK